MRSEKNDLTHPFTCFETSGVSEVVARDFVARYSDRT